MPAHRFRSLIQSSSSSLAPSSSLEPVSGFVACPALLVSVWSVPQHQFIEEVYRIARERTLAQLRPTFRLPEFSVN